MVFKSSFYAPLGLMYVATYARTKLDIEARFFDFELGCTRVEDLAPLLQEWQPDVVALTGYTFAFYDTLSVCRLAKHILPQTTVVMGGPHVDVYPEETFYHDCVDFLVSGEGEETFVELLEHLAGERDLESIRGLYWRGRGRNVHFGGARDRFPVIDDIPFPDRELLADKPYHTIVNPAFREASMISSRGCPYRCNFCNVFEKKYRYRSAGNVVAEMQEIENQGFDYIHFFDDTFNLFKRKVKDLCRTYLEANLSIEWAFRGRVDHVDEEMFDLLRRSNCRRVYFGVEAGTDAVLSTIGKQTTLAQARNAFGLAHRFGIEIMGYFMIGFPDETPAQMQETIRTAIELGPQYVQVLITTPLPGTALYREAMAEGAIPGDYFRDYVLNPVPEFRMRPWNRYLDEAGLVAMSRRFYRKFYFRPRYMIDRVREIRSPHEFSRKAAAALSLVGFQAQRMLPKQS